jgi:hypothetical protein
MDKLTAWTLGALLFGSFGTAAAVPMTFVDTIDANSDICLSQSVSSLCAGSVSSAGPSHSLSHNIIDDGFLTTDIIISASLLIDLDDDGPFGDSPAEKVDIALDVTQMFNNQNAGVDFTFNYDTGFASLSDGMLVVNLYRQNGDFLFADSTLTVVVDRNSTETQGTDTQVPEPATLLLLGTGLGGLALASRRRYKH